MIHLFDHRWATFSGGESRTLTIVEKADPTLELLPRYRVPKTRVADRIATKNWTCGWLMGWRGITNATNERTIIAAMYPATAIGHSIRNLFVKASPAHAAAFLAGLSSLVADYVARQKTGGENLTVEIVKQLPILPPSAFTESDLPSSFSACFNSLIPVFQ